MPYRYEFLDTETIRRLEAERKEGALLGPPLLLLFFSFLLLPFLIGVARWAVTSLAFFLEETMGYPEFITRGAALGYYTAFSCFFLCAVFLRVSMMRRMEEMGQLHQMELLLGPLLFLSLFWGALGAFLCLGWLVGGTAPRSR